MKPNKLMGQNFLASESALKKIAAAAETAQHDTIVEVGPGMGALTAHLLKKKLPLVAIEKDERFIRPLKEKFADEKHFCILGGDILDVLRDEEFLARLGSYVIVANLPYYLSARFLRLALGAKNPPWHMVIMLQKEVAQRICTKPPNMSMLAVMCQMYSSPKILFSVRRGAFRPQPGVDSSVVGFSDIPRTPRDEAELTLALARAGFSQKRKFVSSNLKKIGHCDEKRLNEALFLCSLTPKQRAETLSIEDWKCLHKNVGMKSI